MEQDELTKSKNKRIVPYPADLFLLGMLEDHYYICSFRCFWSMTKVVVRVFAIIKGVQKRKEKDLWSTMQSRQSESHRESPIKFVSLVNETNAMGNERVSKMAGEV